MKEDIINIGGRVCHIISSLAITTDYVIVKPLGEFEWRLLMTECEMIAQRSEVAFTMIAFEVIESDLRPDGAEHTYDYLCEVMMPYVREEYDGCRLILGGYSLGGLFALWCATRLDGISGVYAGSPSLWMDGWDEYADSHPVKAHVVYMGLGDKEEMTRKQPYTIIGDRVRRQHQRHLALMGSERCMLKWNDGGHFKDIELRKADGLAWVMNTIKANE